MNKRVKKGNTKGVITSKIHPFLKRLLERNVTDWNYTDRSLFLEVCGITLPRDILMIIFSFTKQNKPLLNEIGAVNSVIYLCILSSWRSVSVSQDNIHLVEKSSVFSLVVRTVKSIDIREEFKEQTRIDLLNENVLSLLTSCEKIKISGTVSSKWTRDVIFTLKNRNPNVCRSLKELELSPWLNFSAFSLKPCRPPSSFEINEKYYLSLDDHKLSDIFPKLERVECCPSYLVDEKLTHLREYGLDSITDMSWKFLPNANFQKSILWKNVEVFRLSVYPIYHREEYLRMLRSLELEKCEKLHTLVYVQNTHLPSFYDVINDISLIFRKRTYKTSSIIQTLRIEKGKNDVLPLTGFSFKNLNVSELFISPNVTVSPHLFLEIASNRNIHSFHVGNVSSIDEQPLLRRTTRLFIIRAYRSQKLYVLCSKLGGAGHTLPGMKNLLNLGHKMDGNEGTSPFNVSKILGDFARGDYFYIGRMEFINGLFRFTFGLADENTKSLEEAALRYIIEVDWSKELWDKKLGFESDRVGDRAEVGDDKPQNRLSDGPGLQAFFGVINLKPRGFCGTTRWVVPEGAKFLFDVFHSKMMELYGYRVVEEKTRFSKEKGEWYYYLRRRDDYELREVTY